VTRVLRTFRRLRDEDAGLSLTELLVSSIMTLLILAMVGTMFIQIAKITTQSTQTTKSNNATADIANEITAVLRVATTNPRSGATLPDPAIVEGSRESLTVYSLSNTSADSPAPVQVKFSIVDKPGAPRQLLEERCTGVASGGFWNFSTCASTSQRYIGDAILPLTGTSDQLFTYYTANHTEIIIGAGTLSLAQRQTVASIRVYVSVKAAGSTNKQTVISNLVVLSNLGLETE
jgi:Tfp pilus assembly protein PilW